MKILTLILFITVICNRITEARFMLQNPWANQDLRVANRGAANLNAAIGTVLPNRDEGSSNAEISSDGNNVLNLQNSPPSNYQEVTVHLNVGGGNVARGGVEGTIINRENSPNIDPYNGNKVTVNVGTPGGAARTFTSLGNANSLPYNGNKISVKMNPPEAEKRGFHLKGDNKTTEHSNGEKMTSHLRPLKKRKSVNKNVNPGTVSNEAGQSSNLEGHNINNTTGGNRKKMKSHLRRRRPSKIRHGNKNLKKHRTVRNRARPSEYEYEYQYDY